MKRRVVLKIDEVRIAKAADGDMWKFEMLKQNTKTATLMETACDDHREQRQMIADNKILLTRIATTLGILMSILIGTAVVI